MKRKLKIALIVVLAIAVLSAWIAAMPFAYYYFKLPSASELQAGASLKEPFSGFDRELVAVLSTEPVPETIHCLSCLPNATGSLACAETMSAFVARHLITTQMSMGFWEMHNFYLLHAMTAKYDAATIERLYFATLANDFAQADLDGVCTLNYKKKCSDLRKSELRELQVGFRSGNLQRHRKMSDAAFGTCLDKVD